MHGLNNMHERALLIMLKMRLANALGGHPLIRFVPVLLIITVVWGEWLDPAQQSNVLDATDSQMWMDRPVLLAKVVLLQTKLIDAHLTA